MCPLHADANQSQGGDMKRKSHWTITAQETDRRHILASWPQPPTDSSAWLTDVMRYEGGVAPSPPFKKTNKQKEDIKEFISATSGKDLI